jgi:large subunit ribosomal protein L3
MLAILGEKIGMTQIIRPDGRMVAATALLAGPCPVTELKTVDKHGYSAIQIGYGRKRRLREVRLGPGESYELGQEIKADIFKPGDLVDVRGKSIGKGFAGGMKRWHWRGGPGSHGSMFHRRIGSVGASSFPSRTWPGHHMPGRMGNVHCTAQNLEVLKVDAARNLLVVKGAVPGGDHALLFIRRSLKKPEGVKAKVEAKKVEKKKEAPAKKKEEKK